ncbi:uncharacterized protein B0H18DRAFT_987396 [Fomitopsis serialis]|uniref:uncharacterized protein n=1 Tax=Fomitopsis serialis TaxID=139415 RepID=UPI0020080017|nr:uncharacterized protein B0H18DRAFT_987396 [Neoantrodia serialis]KAH9932280.1 hypothetical protein B0H18DRAFT_987396 [Neoantrodia serialis]
MRCGEDGVSADVQGHPRLPLTSLRPSVRPGEDVRDGSCSGELSPPGYRGQQCRLMSSSILNLINTSACPGPQCPLRPAPGSAIRRPPPLWIPLPVTSSLPASAGPRKPLSTHWQDTPSPKPCFRGRPVRPDVSTHPHPRRRPIRPAPTLLLGCAKHPQPGRPWFPASTTHSVDRTPRIHRATYRHRSRGSLGGRAPRPATSAPRTPHPACSSAPRSCRRSGASDLALYLPRAASCRLPASCRASPATPAPSYSRPTDGLMGGDAFGRHENARTDPVRPAFGKLLLCSTYVLHPDRARYDAAEGG